ncbi:MAG: hypothetical protein ACFE75_11040 [Candidatus Hodarchaeota archaeon]
MMPNPLLYIAPFTLLLAAFIFIISAIFYVRKKIWKAGKKWIGIPTSLGTIALLVLIPLFYVGYIFLFFIGGLPMLILIVALIIAETRYRINVGRRYDYKIVAKEKNWKITAGRISPIFIIIGATILLLYYFNMLIFSLLFWSIRQLTSLFTCLWSLMALTGIIMGLRGKKIARFICLIAGILATAGIFIPITTEIYPYYTIVIYLSGSLYYFEPILILIGGIIGIASGDDFLKYYINKYEFIRVNFDLKEEMDKIEDLKTFLEENLLSDWEKIKISFEAYKAGELEKDTFIQTAIKNVGNKFIEIFKKQVREKLNEP